MFLSMIVYYRALNIVPMMYSKTLCSSLYVQQFVPANPITPNLSLLTPLSCFPDGSDGKESACHAGDPGSNLGSGKSPREGWLPIPVLLLGEFQGERSLAGYSLWGCKELATTEQLTLSLPIPFRKPYVCLLCL